MLQSIKYFSNDIQKYWTDENYIGYVFIVYDQKNQLSYVARKSAKIEKSKNYYGSGKVIKRIENARGDYFLKKIILGVCYSKEELIECEAYCKILFNTLNNKEGYNIIGKEDCWGDVFTNNPDKENIREKHRQNALNGITLKNKRREFSEEYRQNLSNSLKGKPSFRKGISYVEEFGEERAEEIKEKQKKSLSDPTVKKNRIKKYKKTLQENPEILIERGKKISKAQKGRISSTKGKTYEEIYGEERAKKILKKGLKQ
jgi:hypothetical protein